jgi:hypothetical protein
MGAPWRGERREHERRGVLRCLGLRLELPGLHTQEHKRQLLSAAFARRSVEELREMRITHVRMLLRV